MPFSTALAACEAAFVAAATGRIDHLRKALIRFDEISAGHSKLVQAHGRDISFVPSDGPAATALRSKVGSPGQISPQPAAADGGNQAGTPSLPTHHTSSKNTQPSTVAANTLHPRRGWGPLHAAARYGQAATVAQLLLWGANANLPNSKDKSASTALLLACKYGHAVVVCCLLEAHAAIPKLDSPSMGVATGLGAPSGKQGGGNRPPPFFRRASTTLSMLDGASGEEQGADAVTAKQVQIAQAHFSEQLCGVPSVWAEQDSAARRSISRLLGALDLEACDNYGRTALIAAAEVAGAETKISAAAWTAGEEDGTGTFLTEEVGAAGAEDTSLSHLLCLQLLLLAGAAVNAGTNERGSALLRASCRGDATMVRALLLCGANPNTARKNPTRKWLFATTPVVGAVMAGSLEVLSHLVAAKGDIKVPVRRSLKPRDIAPKSLVDVAAAMGRAHVVEWLAEQGLSVNVSPLLLRQGLRAGPNWGTPLMRAAQGGFAQAVETLLKHGADASPKNGIGATALHCACVAGADDCVEFICNAIIERADPACPLQTQIDAQDAHGMTPLAAACAFGPGSAVCLATLLAAGAACNGVDRSMGNTPMMAVIDNRNCSDNSCLEAVELLVHRGATFSTGRASDGSTALHLACAAGRSKVAALLVALGSDLSARDVAGHTPSDVACTASMRLATMPLGYEIRFKDIAPAVCNWLAVAAAVPVTAPAPLQLAPFSGGWPQSNSAVVQPPVAEAAVQNAYSNAGSGSPLPGAPAVSAKLPAEAPQAKSKAAVSATEMPSDASNLPGSVPGLGGLGSAIVAFGTRKKPTLGGAGRAQTPVGESTGGRRLPPLPPTSNSWGGSNPALGGGGNVVWGSVQTASSTTLQQLLLGLCMRYGSSWCQHVIHTSSQIVPASAVGAYVLPKQAAALPPALQWSPPSIQPGALPPPSGRGGGAIRPPFNKAAPANSAAGGSARQNVTSSRTAARRSEAEFEAAIAGIRRYAAASSLSQHEAPQAQATGGAKGAQSGQQAPQHPLSSSAANVEEDDGLMWDADPTATAAASSGGENDDDDDTIINSASGIDDLVEVEEARVKATSEGGGIGGNAPHVAAAALPGWGTGVWQPPLPAAASSMQGGVSDALSAQDSSPRAGDQPGGLLRRRVVDVLALLPQVSEKACNRNADMYVQVSSKGDSTEAATTVRFDSWVSVAQSSAMYTDGTQQIAGAATVGAPDSNGPPEEASEPTVPLACIIGRGGHGIVWSGLWQGNPVAVKELTTGAPESDGRSKNAEQANANALASSDSTHDTDDVVWRRNQHAVQSMQREIRMLRSIQSSPLITSCYGLARRGDAVYAVLELVPGMSLRTFLNHKQLLTALSLQQRTMIASSLLHAVAHLHNQHIAHRDLHADNIMVSAVPTGPPDGVHFRVKVIDFGLALQLQGGASDDISRAAARRTHRGLSKPTSGGLSEIAGRNRTSSAHTPSRRRSAASGQSQMAEKGTSDYQRSAWTVESKSGSKGQAKSRRNFETPKTPHQGQFEVILSQPKHSSGTHSPAVADTLKIRRGGRLAPSQLRLAEGNSTGSRTPMNRQMDSTTMPGHGNTPREASETMPLMTPGSMSAFRHFEFKNIDEPATPAAAPASKAAESPKRRSSYVEEAVHHSGAAHEQSLPEALDPWAAQRDMLGVAALVTWLLLGAEAGEFSLGSWETHVRKLGSSSSAVEIAAAVVSPDITSGTSVGGRQSSAHGLAAAVMKSRGKSQDGNKAVSLPALALLNSARGSFGDFLAPVWRVSCGVKPFPPTLVQAQMSNAGGVPRLNKHAADAVRITLMAADLSIPGAVAAGSRRAAVGTSVAALQGASLRGATNAVMAAQEMGWLAGQPAAGTAAPDLRAVQAAGSKVCHAPGLMQPSSHAAFRADACLNQING